MRRQARVVGHVFLLTLRADWKVALLVGIIVCAQAGSAAMIALAQRWVVDSAGAGIGAGLFGAAALGAVGHAAIAAGNRVQTNLRQDLGDRVDLVLAHEVLGDAAGSPTIEHLERPDYLDRLTALRRGTRELAAFCWSLAETAASLISLALSVWLLVSVHPALGLLALLGFPPLLLARRGHRVVRRVLDACSETVRQEQHLHELCILPEPAKEVRIAGNGAYLGGLAGRLWASVVHRETAARVRGAAWQAAGWACYLAGFGVALVIVTSMARDGTATTGDIVMVISLASRLRGQISVTISGVNQLGAAGHVTDHYLWLRDYAAGQPRGVARPPARLAHGIRLEGVRFGYPGTDADALRDISIHLPAGATVGLVGANGAGKTTLVKLLTGMHRPSEGTISVDGQPMSDLDPVAWSARQSGAFQDFVKPQLPAGQCVGIGDLPRLDDEAAVLVAAERAGAREVFDSLDAGTRTQLGLVFGGTELSHGQWQKLALGRAAMREDPLLLVLDEPTAALDPQAEHDLFERFADRARGAAARVGAITLLISHRFSTVHMADHIVVLADGHIVEQGTHAELLAAGGTYADLYQTQVKSYS